MRAEISTGIMLHGIVLILIVLAGILAGCGTRITNKKFKEIKAKFPVIVIAHRGFSGIAPENTLLSFEKSIDAGVDFIELDVRLSKDGHVVVIHDDTVNRTTNGKGNVADFMLKELKEFDAGSWYHKSFSSQKIPTLDEVFKLTGDRVLINIELKATNLGKNYDSKDLADITLNIVRKAEMLNKVLFSSFDESTLERITERSPEARVALLYNKPWNHPGDVTSGKKFKILNCRKSVLNAQNILNAHSKGVIINVYTVNTEEEMKKFIEWKVDGIITDYPDILINILKKMKI